MADLTTLSYIKAWAGISNSQYDAFISARISDLSAELINILNNPILLATYTESYSGAASSTLKLHKAPVTAVTSVTIDQYDGFPTTIAGANIIIDTGPGIISINTQNNLSISYFPYPMMAGQNNISVTYAAGYTTVPLEIQACIAKAVIRQLKLMNKDLTLSSYKLGDESYTRRGDVDNNFTDQMLRAVWKYQLYASC